MGNGTAIALVGTRDFLLSAESFVHAIRVLMHGYALVSMGDEPGSEWVALGTALARVATVGDFSRANS